MYRSKFWVGGGSDEDEFYITIVACVREYNNFIFLMFIYTRKRLNSEVMDDFCIKCNTDTVSSKLFINTQFILKYIKHLTTAYHTTKRYLPCLYLMAVASTTSMILSRNMF